MQIESKRFNISLNIIFVLLAVMTVFPVLLVFSISFTDQSAIAKFGYQLIPSTFSLDAYRYIFASDMLLVLLGQSFSDCFHIFSFLETFVYSHGFLIYSYRIFGDRLLRQTE